jgi:uncharacterized protein YprB with RNaseH-like and TPR domain
MTERQREIEELRRRMAEASARADRQLAAVRVSAPDTAIEKWVEGRIVETAWGRHFEHERAWHGKRRYGSMDIGSLAEMPADWLGAISEGELRASDVRRWAFLDTETTGLVANHGASPFLIGVGRVIGDGLGGDGFQLKQYFMRDFGEEASMLAALSADLEDVETLVTYNGKAFDLPLLENRYRVKRGRSPFGGMQHLDLLFGARRLWGLRLESCRLTHLESQMLGYEREDDIPGGEIPQTYLDYLQKRSLIRMRAVFEHNALDVLGLACLTAVIPGAFAQPEIHTRHAAEMVSMGRWLLRAGKEEEALALFRKALFSIDRTEHYHRGRIPDEVVYRTLWDMALIERRNGQTSEAVTRWTELAGFANPHQIDALVELTKDSERREKNLDQALAWCEQALAIAPGEEDLRRRRERLQKRHSRPGRTKV